MVDQKIPSPYSRPPSPKEYSHCVDARVPYEYIYSPWWSPWVEESPAGKDSNRISIGHPRGLIAKFEQDFRIPTHTEMEPSVVKPAALISISVVTVL